MLGEIKIRDLQTTKQACYALNKKSGNQNYNAGNLEKPGKYLRDRSIDRLCSG
jgi:hypothetical protein